MSDQSKAAQKARRLAEKGLAQGNRSFDAARAHSTRANRWFWSDAPLNRVLEISMKRSVQSIYDDLETARKSVILTTERQKETAEAFAREAGLAVARLKVRRRFIAARRAKLLAESDAWRASLPLHECDWKDGRWPDWVANPASLSASIRIGTKAGPLGIQVPVTLPFIGQGRTVLIRHSDATEQQARDLVQNLVLRMALAMPFALRFTLIDPKTLGRAYPLAGLLARKRPDDDDLRRLLQTIKGEIRDIGAKIVQGAAGFEVVQEGERQGYEREAIFLTGLGEMQAGESWLLSDLKQIAPNAPVCGRYLFLTHNRKFELRDTKDDQLGQLTIIDMDALAGVTLDDLPPSDLATTLLTRAAAAEPPRRKADWSTTVGIPAQDWWQSDATHEISTPVGANRRTVWFGERQNEGSCVHGLVAGTAGSGKSKLLHTIILGLAERYPPSELQMLLVDGKGGVEFQAYQALPHARVVSLRTAPVFALAVLEYLHEQMRERFALFEAAGVAGYPSWRQQNPDGVLPRLLLVADEYQQFFEKDATRASTLLANLSAQGRAAGVHVLLASQKFTAQGMVQVETILKNMHLRIALRTPDARSLSEFGPRGKSEIEQLSAPGTAVLNDKAGADPNSERVAIVPIERNEIGAVVAALVARTGHDPRMQALTPPIVFNGSDQPPPSANRMLATLAAAGPQTPDAMATLARRPREAGGLGLTQWLTAESPLLLWLGQAYSVHGHLPIMLRRAGGQALLAVGEMPVLHHMLAGAIAGLSATIAPGRLRLDVLDQSVPGTPGSGVLAATCAQVLRPAGHQATADGDPAVVLAAYTSELARRQADPPGTIGDPPWLLVLAEPERAATLRRPDRGSPESGGLRALLRDGPERGLHLVIASSSARTVAQVLDDRRDLQLIDHRVALQMSDADSITVLGNREAARLSQVGEGASAVYFNVAQGQLDYFKPYRVADKAGASGDAVLLADLAFLVRPGAQ